MIKNKYFIYAKLTDSELTLEVLVLTLPSSVDSLHLDASLQGFH